MMRWQASSLIELKGLLNRVDVGRHARARASKLRSPCWRTRCRYTAMQESITSASSSRCSSCPGRPEQMRLTWCSCSCCRGRTGQLWSQSDLDELLSRTKAALH